MRKSIEECESFRNGDHAVTRRTGWRFGSWTVTTTDDRLPDLRYETVVDNDRNTYRVNLYTLQGTGNIEEIEFIETCDGCWVEYDWSESAQQDERERLQNLIHEEDFYTVFEEFENWVQGDTQYWICGPIRIDNEADEEVRVISHDEHGNVIDFVAE